MKRCLPTVETTQSAIDNLYSSYDFDSFIHDPSNKGCSCCDICSVNCNCGDCQSQKLLIMTKIGILYTVMY